MQTNQNCTRFLTSDYESQKILGRCHTDPKRTQMPARLRYPAKLSITTDGEIEIFLLYTISFHTSRPIKDNKWKAPTQRWKLHHRKSMWHKFQHQSEHKETWKNKCYFCWCLRDLPMNASTLFLFLKDLFIYYM